MEDIAYAAAALLLVATCFFEIDFVLFIFGNEFWKCRFLFSAVLPLSLEKVRWAMGHLGVSSWSLHWRRLFSKKRHGSDAEEPEEGGGSKKEMKHTDKAIEV